MNKMDETPSGESNGIHFRPLHSGVGFHPFSDGLPYAPAVPSTRKPQNGNTMGTGAVAAGLPRPVFIPQPKIAQTPIQAAPVSPMVAPAIEKNFSWTYPLARFYAFIIDSALNVLLTAAAVTVGFAFADLDPWFLLEPSIFAVTAFFLMAFSWALMASQEILFKTTVGKRAVGLKIRGSTGAILLRSFLFIPSFAFCGLGLAWAFFDRDKRCWHDLATELQPTRMTQL